MRAVRYCLAALSIALAVHLAGAVPAVAQGDTNLARTATATSSTNWDEVDYIAEKANDGDPKTRWNSAAGDRDGSWLALEWSQAQTINKVVVRQAFNRTNQFEIQTFDTGKNDWVTVYTSPGSLTALTSAGDPVFTVGFQPALTTTGLRLFMTKVTEVPSIYELEAYNASLGTLQGTVKDPDGKGIPGAQVVAGGNFATTNDQGAYAIYTDPGTYDITVRKSTDYSIGTLNGVQVTAGSSTEANVVLTFGAVNLARAGTASASSSYDETDYVAAKAIDGDLTTRWNTAVGDIDGSWIQIDWNTPQTFNEVVIRQNFNRIGQFELQVPGATADEWKTIYTSPEGLTGILPAGDQVHLIGLRPAVTAKALRLVAITATDLPTIWELQVFYELLGQVKGTVKDPSGTVVPGALVRVGNNATATDANGAYVQFVPPGTYDVIITKPADLLGHVAWDTVVEADGTATVDVALKAAPAVTEPTNLALNATAASSSNWDETTYIAMMANDGDPATRWNSAGGDTAGSWLELAWDSPQTFNKVTTRQAFDRIRDYSLQVPDASGTYTDIYRMREVPRVGGDPVLAAAFPTAVTASKLRLFFHAVDEVPSIYEVEVANTPVPVVKGTVTDKATGKPVSGATVSVVPNGPVTTTDANGAYAVALGAVDFDGYAVTAAAEGYDPSGDQPFTPDTSKAATVAITLTPTGGTPPTVVPGDVNLDGKLAIGDVVDLLRSIAGLKPLNDDPATKAAADANADGKISITDVVFMLRKIAGLVP